MTFQLSVASRILLAHWTKQCCVRPLSTAASAATSNRSDLNQLSLKYAAGNTNEQPLSSQQSGGMNASTPPPNSRTQHYNSDTQVTTLSNGLRVASQNAPGIHCSLGVIIKAGPRHEAASTSGVSHYLEKLGFHSSENLTDREAVEEEMQKCSAIFDCQIAKDFIIYAVSGLSANTERLVELLSETILRPRISDEEMEMATRSIGFERQALDMGPPIEPILNELAHATAFNRNTLGLPRYCPEENLGQIQRQDLIQFMSTHYKPERMVIAGAGLEHDVLVRAVEKSFSRCQPSLFTPDAPPPDTSVAQYTGGVLRFERDLSRYHAPMSEYAHLVLGLPSVGFSDPQYPATFLLQALLGGGGSFSAGGPGKGMYTRLYTSVLNQHMWINSARAENHVYSDAGLFCITGSCPPGSFSRLGYVLARQLTSLAHSGSTISPSELDRAKSQLKSMILMNLETKPGAFEDIARQVLFTNQRQPPEHWADCIDSVTESQLRNIVEDLLNRGPPTIVAYGKIGELPGDEQLNQMFSREIATPERGGAMRFLFKKPFGTSSI